MSLLQWKSDYELGIESIDHEHRQLIDLINQLYADLGSGPDAQTREFLGELYARISAHFALEEAMMRNKAYDQLAEHKADHERLLDQLADIMDEFERSADDISGQLGRRLDEWFTAHFRSHDARLHRRLP